MKKILLAIGVFILIVFMLSTVSFAGWATAYKQLTGSGNDQEVLAVESHHYCRIKCAYVCNDGSTTSTVSMHFEDTASATNRIIPPISLAAGEGVIIDYPENKPLSGAVGKDIDIDISDATTINAFVIYEVVQRR